MNRTERLSARAVARLERRRRALESQLLALVVPELRLAIERDPELRALVDDAKTDDSSSWPPELERLGKEAVEAVFHVVGAVELAESHDQLAARLNRYYAEVNDEQ